MVLDLMGSPESRADILIVDPFLVHFFLVPGLSPLHLLSNDGLVSLTFSSSQFAYESKQ